MHWLLLVSGKATHTEPRAVPRMVCGLKNLQHASLNSETLSAIGRSDPAAPTLLQAYHNVLHFKVMKHKYHISKPKAGLNFFFFFNKLK